jgi:hypothetical protein
LCERKRLLLTPFQENTQGEVNLDDDNVVAVRRMMQWFYCHDYNDSPRVPLNAFSAGAVVAASLHVNALVYAIADKYHIPGLKSLSVDKTYKLFQNVVDITVFIPAVKAVWNSTPSRDRGLRDLYIRFITTCRTQFQVHRGFMDLLRSDGALATELLTTSWDVLTSIQNGHAGVPAAENVGPRSS